MVSLNSLDVLLYIALFLDPENEKGDLKNLSLLNRVVYDALTRRRVQNLLVYPSDLPSLALFLIRSRASKHCRSLKISDEPRHRNNMFGPTNFENFSRALVLRMLGTCKGNGLQYFEGRCSEPTSPLLWKILNPPACKEGGSASCIELSPGDEDEERYTIQWLYPGADSHHRRIKSGKEEDSKPLTEHVHLPSTSSEVRNLLNPENERLHEIPTWRLTFEEVLLSSHSMKEMVLHIQNPFAWDAILRADWCCLSHLELVVVGPQQLDESLPPQPMLKALETFKLTFRNKYLDLYLGMDFTIPSLRSLHFSGGNARSSKLNEVLNRHADHLQALSLHCDAVPDLRCLKALRALHLEYKQDALITYEQLNIYFSNLRNVVLLRVPENAVSDFPKFNQAFLRSLRCLEIECARPKKQYTFGHIISRIPELKELAFIFNEEINTQLRDGKKLQESIPLILRECARPKSLDAVRIVYKGNADVRTSDLTVKSWKTLENLRYLITDRGASRRAFRIANIPVVLESSAWYSEPTEAVELEFEEIAPLRPFPPPGKRLIDWTDESFYDHVSPNYDV